jgi:hypothetical protein
MEREAPMLIRSHDIASERVVLKSRYRGRSCPWSARSAVRHISAYEKAGIDLTSRSERLKPWSDAC